MYLLYMFLIGKVNHYTKLLKIYNTRIISRDQTPNKQTNQHWETNSLLSKFMFLVWPTFGATKPCVFKTSIEGDNDPGIYE
jgi:hypothetical protein